MVDIGAMVQGTAGIVQGIHGLIQRKKGRDMLKGLDRPKYEIPDEVLKNVSQAERMALQGLPEEQKMQYVERMQQSQAGQLASMKTLGGGLRGMAGIQNAQQESNQQLLSMDAQARMQNMLQATHQRALLGQKKDEQWSINKYQPYVQKYNEAQALIGAGEQNFAGGINTVAQSGANYGSMGFGGSGGSGGGQQSQAYGTGGNQVSTNPFGNAGMQMGNQSSQFALKDVSLNMYR